MVEACNLESCNAQAWAAEMLSQLQWAVLHMSGSGIAKSGQLQHRHVLGQKVIVVLMCHRAGKSNFSQQQACS